MRIRLTAPGCDAPDPPMPAAAAIILLSRSILAVVRKERVPQETRIRDGDMRWVGEKVWR